MGRVGSRMVFEDSFSLVDCRYPFKYNTVPRYLGGRGRKCVHERPMSFLAFGKNLSEWVSRNAIISCESLLEFGCPPLISVPSEQWVRAEVNSDDVVIISAVHLGWYHLSRGSIDKTNPARVGTGFIRWNLPRRTDAAVGRGGEGVAKRG